MAPRVGFEPTTYRLTAGCSTAELSGNIKYSFYFRSSLESFEKFFPNECFSLIVIYFGIDEIPWSFCICPSFVQRIIMGFYSLI